MRALRKRSYRSTPGDTWGTPKEVWGFRTARSRGRAPAIARDFLRANAALFGLEADLSGLEHQKTIPSLGAWHVIFQQRHLDRRIHRAYVTVHVARDGSVFLAKNRATPADWLPAAADFHIPRSQALARARRALPQRSRRSALLDAEQMWFFDREKLRPAWRFRLARRRPREEWLVYVNAATGGLLKRYDNLAFASGRGRVFDPSPVTALGGHEALLTKAGHPRRPPAAAYRTVTLRGLAANGRLDGTRVTTRPTAARRRVRRVDRRFLFDAHQKGFEEVMVYHHVDSALRYLERLGFRGRLRIFGAPVRVDVNGSPEDNSWYSPYERLLTFGTGAIDDAEDGETILHELGHAIQDAIVPDFGQSEEAAAMGEGFGDYFAASLFAERKPARYRPCVMTWDGLLLGLEEKSAPPCLRRVDGKRTYAGFDPEGDEHDNGEIWSATLWDVRAALGGEAADRLIVESHFQLDGFTSFARGARAILDADRNLNRGRNALALRRVFRRRRIGPL